LNDLSPNKIRDKRAERGTRRGDEIEGFAKGTGGRVDTEKKGRLRCRKYSHDQRKSKREKGRKSGTYCMVAQKQLPRKANAKKRRNQKAGVGSR